jgi:hypothetical protein
LKESTMFSQERGTAARQTTALALQESNLRAAQKGLRNAPFARCEHFILRFAFHSESGLESEAYRFHVAGGAVNVSDAGADYPLSSAG